jgi:hypothetical protein
MTLVISGSDAGVAGVAGAAAAGSALANHPPTLAPIPASMNSRRDTLEYPRLLI